MLGLSVSPKSKKEKNDRWIKPLNQGREGKNKALDNHLQYYFMEKRANQKPNEWKKTIMSGNFKSQILSPAGREESSFSFQSRKLNETLDTRSSNTKSFLIKENVKVTPVVPTISKITPNPADTTFDHSPSVDNRSSVSRNQTQRRTAFEDLISMFSGSSTKKPIKLFENSFFDTSRSNFTRKYLIPKSDSFIWDDIKESHKSDEKKVVDIVSIIPSLIKTSKMNNTQMLIKEFHQEIVQIKDFAWETIVNMLNVKKIEFVIVNMIKFAVEAVFEILIPDEKLAEKIDFCMKENNLYLHEARHILIYLHDETDKKKLLVSKFVFHIKSDHNFPKGLKDEKDIILYYQTILGILEFRYKTEANPLCTAIPKLRELALEYIYKKRELQFYLKEWFQGRISNGFFVEKHYSYPNPRGKDSNIYEFDIKEYFALRYTEKKNSISPIRLTTLPNESDQARPQTTIFRSESDKKLLSTKSNNFIKISQIINKNAQIIQVIPNKVDLEISGLAPPNVASTNFSNKSNQVPRKLTTVKKFQKTEDNYKTPSDVSLVDYDTGAPRQILDERKLRPKKNYSRSTTRLRGTKPIEEKVDFTSLNMRFNDIKVPIFESSIMKTYMSGVNGQTPGGH